MQAVMLKADLKPHLRTTSLWLRLVKIGLSDDFRRSRVWTVSIRPNQVNAITSKMDTLVGQYLSSMLIFSCILFICNARRLATVEAKARLIVSVTQAVEISA